MNGSFAPPPLPKESQSTGWEPLPSNVILFTIPLCCNRFLSFFKELSILLLICTSSLPWLLKTWPSTCELPLSAEDTHAYFSGIFILRMLFLPFLCLSSLAHSTVAPSYYSLYILCTPKSCMSLPQILIKYPEGL